MLIVVLGLGAFRLLSRKLLYFPQPLSPGRRQALEKMLPQIQVRPLTVTAKDGTRLAGWCIEKDSNLPGLGLQPGLLRCRLPGKETAVGGASF